MCTNSIILKSDENKVHFIKIFNFILFRFGFFKTYYRLANGIILNDIKKTVVSLMDLHS